MPGRLSDLMNGLYDPKKRQFLGRDGAGWTKLGVFYFFFYLGLAGFFCAMLAVFMALSPRDHPAYVSESSRMATRSNPLSPGLGFRPQPDPDKNIVVVDKTLHPDEQDPYARSLDQYLQIYYWKQDKLEMDEHGRQVEPVNTHPKFSINYRSECENGTQFGYKSGRPCVLVKMNKIVGFMPEPGSTKAEESAYKETCEQKSGAISIHCHGEYPADEDNVGSIRYYSEDSLNEKCGTLSTKWFPYEGKTNRRDTYQAPYIWVQFLNPKPNVLINVMCRAYGKNIYFDKKSGRALTRFQIYVKNPSTPVASQKSGEI